MLSNKLTFSLTFTIALILGLALTATPALAASWSTTWTSDTGWGLTITLTQAEHETIEEVVGTLTAENVTQWFTVAAPNTLDANPTVDADASDGATHVFGVTASPVPTTAPDSANPQMFSFTLLGYDAVMVTQTDAEAQSGTLFISPVPLTTIEVDFEADQAFRIIAKNEDAITATNTSESGILAGEAAIIDPAADLPDLATFFVTDVNIYGGTLEVGVATGDPETTLAKDLPMWNDVVVTEIMWGHDITPNNPADDRDDDDITNKQWIEVYNNTGDTRGAMREIECVLVFTPDRYVERDIFTHDGTSYDVVDRVSNVRYARWAMHGNSGNTQPIINPPTPVNSLVSMYRTRLLNATRDAYMPGTKFEPFTGAKEAEHNGTLSNGWRASLRRANIRGPYVASPGRAHVYEELARTESKTPVPRDRIIISEFRNDSSDENLDWIEFYNRTDADINIKDWDLSFVKAAYDEQHYDIPDQDSIVPAKGYLLIVNRQPHDDALGHGGTNLAGAVTKGKAAKDGAVNRYVVDSKFSFPNQKFLMVLRHKKPDRAVNGESEDAYIEDLAGDAYFADTNTFGFNTDVWPLKGWRIGVDLKDSETFAGDGGDLTDKGYANRTQSWGRRDFGKPWYHKDSWGNPFGHEGGLGWDRHANLAFSPGTPGYANSPAVKVADHPEADDLSISEIMYDAGPRLDLVQWIEIYNPSRTTAVSLSGWKLEIRNLDDPDERISPVDAIVPIKGSPRILPNQTLLIVSAAGPNNLESDNHIYNLQVQNKDDLNLRTRRDVLLSEAGFYIALRDPNNKAVDEAGNLQVGRGVPVKMWNLPEGIENLTESRRSIRRLYGLPMVDREIITWGEAGADEKADGLAAVAGAGAGVNRMTGGWYLSDLSGTTHYGHPNDLSNPGYRRGGPLPVSLSSFRPARDKATGEVVIRWITQSELNNAGFNILRSETKTGEFKVVNLKGLIPGQGTTSEKHVYEWKDTTAKPNVVYYYQIEDVSLDGKRTTLATTHLRGNVNAAGKATTTWGDLKTQ